MRIASLLIALAMTALPALAQTDYTTVADSAALVDGGVLADVDISCMDRLSTGEFVFYNFPTGDIAAHDATTSTTRIVRSDAQIDADISGDADGCFAIDVDGADNIYLALQDSTNIDLVYRTDGASGAVLAPNADGITGLAVLGSTVFLARVAFFGAPEDGFYRINTFATGQTPTVVVTNPNLDLIDLEVGADGSLYSSSSEFGAAPYQNVVVRVNSPLTSPTLEVVYDPFADEIFVNPTDGGLEDLELGADDRLYLYNNSFAGPDGEEWGTALPDGSMGEKFADEAAMVADPDTDLTEYTSPNGRQMVFQNDELCVASRDAFGGADEIVCMTDIPGVAGDAVAVDIEPAGSTTVPAGGGPISYTVSLTNTTGESQTVTARVDATLPNGSSFGPVQGPRTVTLRPGQTLGPVSFTSNVPSSAPAGAYTLTLSLDDGTEDSFTFTKAASRAALVAGGELGVYPNPFATEATFRFAVEEAAEVRLAVYDVLGREVAVLAEGPVEAGQHEAVLAAEGLASGVYVWRLAVGSEVETGRLTLAR